MSRRSQVAQPEKNGGMRVINQSIESVPVDRLTLHPRNVNEGDVGAIHESILHNGFWGTIVAQKSTGRILAGNHRFIAAKEAGATEVPVAWVDVDDETALRILLADNRTTRLGRDDPRALAELLEEILAGTGTLDGTAFDGDDLDELLRDLGNDHLPDYSEANKEIDPDNLLADGTCVCPRCHFEFKP